MFAAALIVFRKSLEAALFVGIVAAATRELQGRARWLASGVFVGVLGAQFIVSQPLPRLVMFVGATVLHELCFQALYSLAEVRAFHFAYTSVLTQALVNGLIGIIAFQVVEAGPGLVQRRRSRGATLNPRRF